MVLVSTRWIASTLNQVDCIYIESGARLDLGRAPYVVHGVEYIDLVPVAD